jgi:phospholipase C
MPAHHERISRRAFLSRSAMAVAGATLFSCTGGRPIKRVTDSPSALLETQWPIKQVVYLMMENRSFNNLFGRFPGANGTMTGLKAGAEFPLIDCPDWLPGDLPHDRAAYLNCYAGGSYDGFNTGKFGDPFAYSVLNEHQVPAYFDWGREYVLSDNFFSSVAGPSYPNHFFFVAGQSGGTLDNPENIETKKLPDGRNFKSWGCDAVGDNVFVFTKDDHGNLTKHDTCFDFPTVPEQLSGIGVDWAYYAAQPGQSGYFWNALNGIGPVFHSEMFHEHTRSVDTLVADIKANRLPPVTWITPRFELSDHPPESTCFSHNWIADVVNALMRSPMWQHTALFITWDEWGGFYDAVPPPAVDDVGLGFRVPMLTLSPYAKRGYIDDAVGEFSSPLKFIEDNWGLPHLTDRIRKTHNFEHVFDFGREPRTDARPAPKAARCFGTPGQFPEGYQGWPPGTVPDPAAF